MTTREDAIRLAKEANRIHIEDDEFFDFAERLIALVRAEQKELDVKVCESVLPQKSCDPLRVVELCAAAIRKG